MEFNSRIDGLECVEGHLERFLPSPTAHDAVQPRVLEQLGGGPPLVRREVQHGHHELHHAHRVVPQLALEAATFESYLSYFSFKS